MQWQSVVQMSCSQCDVAGQARETCARQHKCDVGRWIRPVHDYRPGCIALLLICRDSFMMVRAVLSSKSIFAQVLHSFAAVPLVSDLGE